MLFFSYTPSGLSFLGYPTQGSASLHPWATILRRFAAQIALSAAERLSVNSIVFSTVGMELLL